MFGEGVKSARGETAIPWCVTLAERNLIQEGQIFDIFCGE